jgi:hypothetical protein
MFEGSKGNTPYNEWLLTPEGREWSARNG